MEEHITQVPQETLSQSLYHIMELAECSVEKRNIQKELTIAKEIIWSIISAHIWTVNPFSVYIFGSQYEGTSLPLMDPDVDMVFAFKRPEVVTHDSQETGLLIIQDEFTPPGYCKLQLMTHGIPLTKFHLRSNTALLEIWKLSAIVTDLHGRIVLGHPLQDHEGFTFQREFHGPAVKSIGIKNKVADRDIVPAIRCRSLLKEAMGWFTRERPFGWPPQEVIEKCRKLGFFVVPVGHPNSKEKDNEWRISLSLQERMLVTMFNSVQLKCFVLMKILKDEVINKKVKEKILTTYHCKTCMLYMVETTPMDFWIPENLLKCLQVCLLKLWQWAKRKRCPNYFIPEENMFDKLAGKDLNLLANTLQTLLSEQLPDILIHLSTCKIGIMLRSWLKINTALPTHISVHSFIDAFIAGIDTLVTDNHLRHKVCVLRECMKPNSGQRRLRLRHKLPFISFLLNMRNRILERFYSKDHKKFAQNLRFITEKLQSETKVTEHSEEETKAAVSLFLPVLKPMLLSTEIAVLKHTGTKKVGLCEELRKDMWHVTSVQSDSLHLKQSCILHVLDYPDESLQALKSIPGGVRFSFCTCVEADLISGDNGGPLNILLHRPDITDDFTIKDLLWNVISPCVPFMLTESDITPTVIIYECLRCLCLTSKPNALCPEWAYQHKIAYMDGQFLKSFLLYLNHDKMEKRDLTWIDILHMNSVVNTRKIGHKASCLNILGWVFKREGLKSKALECFIQSIREEAGRNAAYWHLCFLMSENV